MEPWNLVAGGAAFGVVAGLWSKVKGLLGRIISLFICRVEIPTDAAHHALVAYLIARYQRSRTYDKMYGACYEYMRNGKYGLVPYEQYGTRSMMFWSGWFLFFFSNAVEEKAKAGKSAPQNSDDDLTKVYSTITFVRGTLDVEKILKHACASTNELAWKVSTAQESNNRFVIHHVPTREGQQNQHRSHSNGLAWYQQGYYRLLDHSADQLGKAPTHNGSALENLIFPQRVKDLIKEIELWRNNRQWYVEKGIPWKRGWLLYGVPGTGKTALARAFAEDLNMPIYVFNLAEMSNHELIKSWTDMQVNVPCIALIEDIDNVFHGRENVTRKSGFLSMMLDKKRDENDKGPSCLTSPLTFDCLLNCLDGVERCDGVFTVITTNDLVKIDPALGQPRKLPDGSIEFISTRPGRIDKAVELTFMEVADKKRMAKRILGDYPDQYMAMLEFIDRYPQLEETPAQFQERCGQIALACFWQEQQDIARYLNGAPLALERNDEARGPKSAAENELMEVEM